MSKKKQKQGQPQNPTEWAAMRLRQQGGEHAKIRQALTKDPPDVESALAALANAERLRGNIATDFLLIASSLRAVS